MHDLINEEEFIPKKSNYNPWRSFGVFYIIASAIAISYCIFLKNFSSPKPNVLILFFVLFFLPVIIALVMIFHKKENIRLSKKIIMLSVTLLMGIYYCSLLFMIIGYNRNQMFEIGIDQIITFPVVIIIISIITLTIVLPIKFYKERKSKKLK